MRGVHRWAAIFFGLVASGQAPSPAASASEVDLRGANISVVYGAHSPGTPLSSASFAVRYHGARRRFLSLRSVELVFGTGPNAVRRPLFDARMAPIAVAPGTVTTAVVTFRPERVFTDGVVRAHFALDRDPIDADATVSVTEVLMDPH